MGPEVFIKGEEFLPSHYDITKQDLFRRLTYVESLCHLRVTVMIK